MQTKFKVGDKVKILGNSNYHQFKIGEIVRITEAKTGNYQIAEHLDGHDYYSVLNKEIELVEDVKCSNPYMTATECAMEINSTNINETIRNAYQALKEHSDIRCQEWSRMYTNYINGEPIKINKQTTIMSKITTFAKNLTLTPREKLLRKYGFKDECGDYTSEAQDVIDDKMCRDNEDYLFELATGMEAESRTK